MISDRERSGGVIKKPDGGPLRPSIRRTLTGLKGYPSIQEDLPRVDRRSLERFPWILSLR